RPGPSMKRVGMLVLAAAWSAMAGQAGAETMTFEDDGGRTVTVDGPVETAVVLNRYNVEIVRAVAGADRILGIDEVTARDHAYWPEFGPDQVVGHQAEPNYEAIVALDPDIVVLPRNSPFADAERQLAPFGIPVIVVTSWDTLQYLDNIHTIGTLFGAEERAAELADFYSDTLAMLAERLDGVTPKRVYFEEVVDNRTVLNTSGWHDMIALA